MAGDDRSVLIIKLRLETYKITFKSYTKPVKEYEKYCQNIRDECFRRFFKYTASEDMTELLTKEAERGLNLKGSSD